MTDLFAHWTSEQHLKETVHHIALIHKVYIDTQITPLAIHTFDAQDSSGIEWLPLQNINNDNASPLVLEALQWINTNQLSSHCPTYYFGD